MLRAMAVETDDAQLMLRYRDGGVPAFEALYARHKGRLYRFFLRQTGDGALAAGLFAAVWQRLIRARERYEPRVPFSVFLYQIAHQGLAEHYRAEGIELGAGEGEEIILETPGDDGPGHDEPADESADPAFASARWSLVDWEDKPADAAAVPIADEKNDPRPPPAARAPAASRTDRFQASITALPPGQREAFLLHEEAGLSLAGIAAVTVAAPDEARSRLRLAVQKLHKALDESAALTAGDDGQLEALLARRSSLARDYAGLVAVEPSPELNGNLLAEARAAVPAGRKSASAPPAARDGAAAPAAAPVRLAPRPPPPDPDDDDDDEEAPPPAARPRWLVPAAGAAVAVLVIGAGLVFLGGPGDEMADGSRFMKRDRATSAAKEGVAIDEGGDGEVAVDALEAPVEAVLSGPAPFDLDTPVVDNLEQSIALIRRDLIMSSSDEQTPEALAEAAVIQPRERRLAKILQLYDEGNPELAGDALGIFLRDFEDDPISQRILGTPPPAR